MSISNLYPNSSNADPLLRANVIKNLSSGGGLSWDQSSVVVMLDNGKVFNTASIFFPLVTMNQTGTAGFSVNFNNLPSLNHNPLVALNQQIGYMRIKNNTTLVIQNVAIYRSAGGFGTTGLYFLNDLFNATAGQTCEVSMTLHYAHE
jgi:hypothetical protein